MNDESDLRCIKCGEFYSLDLGNDDDGLCHPCAHKLAHPFTLWSAASSSWLLEQMPGTGSAQHPTILTRWLTVIHRDTATEVLEFADELQARAYYGPASEQWSESYLCCVVQAGSVPLGPASVELAPGVHESTLRAQMNFLRKSLPNDGADGETAHAVADAAEKLARRVAELKREVARLKALSSHEQRRE